MTSLEERIYELGANALAEQERQVVEVRARGAAIIAAAVVIASLLVGPAFRHGHPANAAEIAAAVAGLIGCAGVLVCVVLLLHPHDLAFSVSATGAYGSLWDQGIVESPASDFALVEAFEERQENNRPTVEGLARLLTLALGSLVLETTGLAVAAAVGL
ncbi:MAG TPA: hypothetical protein VL988_04455 [Solirubrobacteraceae bacterium]|nr:hypothetical protein [Solirubrobacteraceae bacterium]